MYVVYVDYAADGFFFSFLEEMGWDGELLGTKWQLSPFC